MDVKAEVWLQTERSDGEFECVCFTGVPTSRPSWIAIVSNGTDTSRKYAAELSKDLEAILINSGPEVVRSTMDCPVAPQDMQVKQYPQRRKVLVLTASEDAQFDDVPWYDEWQSDEYDAAVMTILPRSAKFESMFVPSIVKNKTHVLSRVNASFWEKRIAESAQAVLARADITTASSRIFISYRRVETLAVALQLFDALTRAGFEVFLDRFSIQAGYDFQRRLFQELEDKSMVVLLESRSLKNSKWTQREIDFAKTHRLGLLAVTMPDVRRKQRIVSVRPNARIQLKGRRDFVGRPKWVPDPDVANASVRQWSEVTKEALERLVSEIQRAHTDALFFRRHVLRLDVVAALKNEGVQAEYVASGPLLAGDRPCEHLLWLTTRPPEVEDFRSVYAAQDTRRKAKVISDNARGVIVGPRAALEPDRATRLQWLCDVSNCLSFDEGDLATLARKIKTGVWT